MPKEVKVQIGKEIPPDSVKVPLDLSDGQKNVAVLAVFGLWGLVLMLVCCCCSFVIDGFIHIIGPEWVRLSFMTLFILLCTGGLIYGVVTLYRNRRSL